MTVQAHKNLACLLVLALASGASLMARQGVTIRYVWRKGEPVRYRITQQTMSTISGLPGGMPDVNLDQTTTQTIRITAKDVAADGTSTLEQVVEAVQMTMTTPMGTVNYDSAKPAPSSNPLEEMMGKMFTAMVNVPFSMTLTPTGVVQKVEGVSALAEKAFAGLPQDPQSAQLLAGLKASLSDEGMKGTLSQGFVQLPAQAVKPGETWNASFDMGNPAAGKMTFASVSTLQSVESQIAKIQTKIKITQDPSGPAQAPMGMKVKLNDAQGDAELSFDVSKGRMQKTVTTFVMPSTVSGNAPDGTALSMTNNTKTTVTIELVQ